MQTNRNQLLFLLLLGLAAICGGTYWWLGRSNEPLEDLDSIASGEQPAALPDALTAHPQSRPAEAPGTAGDLSRTAEINPLEATHRSAEPMLLIRVLEQQTRRPVPHAVVRFMSFDPGAMSPELQKAWNTLLDAELRLEKFGKQYLCDAQGQVQVPRPKENGQACARLGQLYGQTWLQREAPLGLEILVQQDLALRVRALDVAGKPVIGLPVALRSASRENQNPELLNGWQWKTEAPDGIATIAHLQLQLGHLAGAQRKTWLAYAQGPGLQAESQTFDPNLPPVDPVLITLPPTGRAVVEVVEASGAAFTGDGWITLQLVGTKRSPSGQQLTQETGRAVFPHVALGGRLRANGWLGTGGEVGPVEVAGPTIPGEEVTLRIGLSKSQPVLIGVALDEKRQPLAEQRLGYVIQVEHGETANHEVKTDKDGRFRILLGNSFAEKKLSRCLFFSQARPCHMARIPLASVPKGTHDLGELVLNQGPLIVGGVAVDESGQPMTEVELGVGRFNAVGARRPRGRDEILQIWSHDIAVQWPAPGRFEVRGYPPEEELRVVARHRECTPCEPLPFRRGQDDLRVQLTRGGSLAATVLTDPGLAIDGLRVVALRDDQPNAKEINTSSSEVRSRDGRGAFTWRALATGSYTLRLRIAPDPEPVVSLTGLMVVAGKACPDPRLTEIDLRGKLREIEFAAVDAEGKPVTREGQVQMVTEAGVSKDQSTRFRSGKASLITARGSFDALVTVASYKRQRLTGVSGDTKIVLEKGFPLRIRLDGLAANSGIVPSLHVCIESDTGRGMPGLPGPIGNFKSEGGWPGFGNWERCARDPKTGEFTCLVSAPGNYVIQVMLEAGDGNSRKSTTTRELDPPLLAVAEATEEQRFVVTIPPATLQKALDKLR